MKNDFLSQGLTSQEAGELLKKYGKNELDKAQSFSRLRIFLEQIKSPLMLILIGAGAVSIVLSLLPGANSDIIDGILIISIVFLSSIFGFFQDYKAEKTMESLRLLATPLVTVIRDGREMDVPSTDVVPGDIVMIESGDIVPADAKVLAGFHLSCDESMLTGESVAVAKKQGDIVYKGSSVQVGRGFISVVKTGMETKLGMIAASLGKIKDEPTSFQKEIKSISNGLLRVITVVIIIIFIVGIFKFSWIDAFIFSISLAVAAIPEGLPAVMTVALAIGAHAMMKKNSLVRKLSAVESMGDIEVICTDKTGTLTRNEMQVVYLYQDGELLQVSDYTGKSLGDSIEKMIIAGAVCNDTEVQFNDDDEVVYRGDQTEVALVKLARNFDLLDRSNIFHRFDENPFTSDRKMMSVLCSSEESSDDVVFAKGAPEILLHKCKYYLTNTGEKKLLDDAKKEEILTQYSAFGNDALRVLGIAYKNILDKKLEELNLVWLGLVAMVDPPHAEVEQAMLDIKNAGIRTIMLTGDNAKTAQAIARLVGLQSAGVISGDVLENMDDLELRKSLDKGINIFARISPFHKLRILRLLQIMYKNVAMTGDGVNDALALKQANVGIAMGIRGSDTAKQASDIILLDDNFSSIRSAVKEGRRSIDNIKKFINYLSVSNLTEIIVLFVATVFLTLKEPVLLPVHILWINLITDGMPALALGFDPAQKNILKRKPRIGSLIDKKLKYLIGIISIKKSIILFVTFIILLPSGLDIARTTLFTGFILYEFVRIATIRQQDGVGWFANKLLVFALLASLALQLVVIYSPVNEFFNVVPLGVYPWVVLITGTVVGYFVAIAITAFINKKMS